MENSIVMPNIVLPTTKHISEFNDHETNRKEKEKKLWPAPAPARG